VDNRSEVPPPVRIDPNDVYRLDTATQLIAVPLGLAEGTLRREVRLGRLRASRRGGRYLLSGRAILAWAEGRTGTGKKRPGPTASERARHAGQLAAAARRGKKAEARGEGDSS
jgi:hypothetical protein